MTSPKNKQILIEDPMHIYLNKSPERELNDLQGKKIKQLEQQVQNMRDANTKLAKKWTVEAEKIKQLEQQLKEAKLLALCAIDMLPDSSWKVEFKRKLEILEVEK